MSADGTSPPQAPSGFTPPKAIDSNGRVDPWQHWENEYDHDAGVSGLYVIEANTIVVDNRAHTHHNQQLRNLLDVGVFGRHDDDFQTVMAFSQGYRPDWSDDTPDSALKSDLELPRSAGGLTQAYQRLNLKGDLRVVQRGMDVTPRVLWPVVWVCRLLGVHDDTLVRFNHAHDRFARPDPDTDGHTVVYDGTKRQMSTAVERLFVLADAYRELEFAGELPEPRVDRDFDVVTPAEPHNPRGGVT